MKIIQSLVMVLSMNSFMYGQTLLIPNGEPTNSSSIKGRVEINGSNGVTNGKQFRVFFGGGGNLLNTEFQALTHLPEMLTGNAWTALYANKGNAKMAAVFNGDVSFFNGNVGIGTENPDKLLTLKANKVLGWEYTGSGSGSHHTITGGGINPMSFTVNPFSANTPIFKFNGNKGTNVTMLNGGNVGIGTESPSSTLEILGRNGAINERNFKVTYVGGGALTNTEFSALTHITHIPNSNGWTALYASQGNAKRAGVFDGDVSVNGLIHTKEVKVDLVGWSDFVFYEDYKLPTLREVETHIKEKGHLKDIPSAKEVEKNGIFLGEMDSKLLQKIEELTLYTIQQEKTLQSQKEDIEKLKKENNALKSLNAKLLEIQKRLDTLESKK